MQSQEEWEAGGYHPGVGCKLKGGGPLSQSLRYEWNEECGGGPVGRYLVQSGNLGHVGDSVGAVLVIVGDDLGLLGREKTGSHSRCIPS